MTVGKPTYQLIRILEQYGEDQDKQKACYDIQKTIEGHLSEVGYENLSKLTESGVLGLLFFMFGAGMINSEMIIDFMSQPHKDQAEFFSISVEPSPDENKLYALKVNYL